MNDLAVGGTNIRTLGGTEGGHMVGHTKAQFLCAIKSPNEGKQGTVCEIEFQAEGGTNDWTVGRLAGQLVGWTRGQMMGLMVEQSVG